MKALTNSRDILPALGTSLFTIGAMAQMPQRTPTPNDTLKSSKVMGDKQVVIQTHAPKASDVLVHYST